MAKPALTLKKILSIIDKDVRRISQAGRNEQLESDDALTLTRYASTLDSILKSTEKEAEKTKKQLSSLPTEELIKQYQKEKK